MHSECPFFFDGPKKLFDGSTSSSGYSVICENPGLFKFSDKSVHY